MSDWGFDISLKGLLAIGFVILTIALLIFSISYAFSSSNLTEEEDEKLHEEWAKENYPKMSYNNTSPSNIQVCGPIHKLMEQWLKPNEYKCHKA